MSQITREQMLQVFENRCSTRYYDPNKKISQEDFAAILEFARLSPSSVGSEPWKFLVIQNKALRDKLKPFSWGMQYQLDDCSHLVIILAKKNARYDTPFFRDIAVRRGLQGEQLEKALAKYKGLQEVAKKNSKILNKIRQLREEKRYSREEMAEKLGMDTSTYTRIENGNVHLKMTTFIMIAMVLGVSMIELFPQEN